MAGSPSLEEEKPRDYQLQPLTEEECKLLIKTELLKHEVHKLKQQESKMEKDKQSKSGVGQHKRLAMGEKIALKKGGSVKKEKAKHKKK